MINQTAILIFGAFFVFIGGLWMLVVKLLKMASERSLKPILERIKGIDKMVASLSMESAKIRALEILSDPDKFICEIVPTKDFPYKDKLSPIVKDFFSSYRKIETKYGNVILDREDISKSVFSPGDIRIGFDSCDIEIIVEPDKERVFVADGSQKVNMRSFPSVYHWIVAVYELSCDEEI